MDLMKMGTDMLLSKLGADGVDGSQASEMLGGLLGDGEGMDLKGLIAGLQSGGAADAVGSWLGSGENQALDTGVLSQVLDSDKLSGMASQLGLDQNDLLGSLAQAIPSLIDKASPGGELLDVGSLLETVQSEGAGGVMGMIGKLFGK